MSAPPPTRTGSVLLVAAAIILAQLGLGGVYAWSTYVPGLHARYGLDLFHTQAVFGTVFAVFVAAMLGVRQVLARWPPAAALAVAAASYAAGHLLAWAGQGNFALLLLGIGGLAAFGIGLGYGTALTVMNGWLPQRPGLATALAVTGFGGGSIVQALLGEWLLARGHEALEALALIGVGAALAVGAAAFVVRRPPQPAPAASAAPATTLAGPWWPLSLAMGCATGSGLLLIGMLKPLMQEAGAAASVVHLGVALLAGGNLSGRLLWGAACDAWGARAALAAPLLLAVTALALPAAFRAPPALALTAIIVYGAAFGACFVIFASLCAQQWGAQGITRVYPRVFTGYGLAGLLIPASGGWLMDRLHSPLLACDLAALLAGAAALIVGGWRWRLSRGAAPR
ncbi:MAG: hypothetical protein RMM29_05865 [Planctomycetota bacterium]|nr:hypothetical protein [Planctomycetota bacterium]MCX8039778.1 hypothetical protein [Planctomycetota bacterium]MDW8373158.1 hypothetical protein [Planctomycetota bacterium]